MDIGSIANELSQFYQSNKISIDDALIYLSVLATMLGVGYLALRTPKNSKPNPQRESYFRYEEPEDFW
jgi:hypothetical protein